MIVTISTGCETIPQSQIPAPNERSTVIHPTIWHWAGFAAFVVVMLTLDLTVFHRENREPTLRNSAAWTLVWCSMALVFNGLIWFWTRQDPVAARELALQFFTGYLIEWTLSMDNVFVFAVIFSYFKVPLRYQYRVLFWGILGAVVMRFTFILLGAQLLKQFDWMMLIFGALLLYTAVKLCVGDNEDVDPEKNILLRIARRLFPIAREDHGQKFFVIEGGKRCITPLFLVLLVIESTDVMFAVDSVPAIFSITKNTFIIFTSNIFAILGLRALYFLLAGVMDMFRYLHYGLAGILGFVGLKMVGDYIAPHLGWVQEGQHLVPIWASLLVIVAFLALAICASLIVNRREKGSASSESNPTAPQPPV